MKLMFTFLACYCNPVYLAVPPAPFVPFFFFFPFLVGLQLPKLLLELKLLLINPEGKEEPPFLFPFKFGETPPEVLIALAPREPLIIPEPTIYIAIVIIDRAWLTFTHFRLTSNSSYSLNFFTACTSTRCWNDLLIFMLLSHPSCSLIIASHHL